MAIPTQFRPTNPRLGTSYATFTSAIAGSVIVLAIFEQLGINDLWLGPFMIGIPVLFYLAIGLMTRTVLVEDFYTSGRRVPHTYNGLALAASGTGGIAFFAFSGALYLVGFDIMALALGWIAGFTLMLVLFVPYLRKFGAYSLPGYLGERFRSKSLRLVAVMLLIVPAMMLLAAEIHLGAKITAYFMAVPAQAITLFIAAVAILMTVFGGLRALTWTQCAQGIVLFLGLLTPLVILTTTFSNLPVPHITYGGLLKQIAALEVAGGLQPTLQTDLTYALPGPELGVVHKPFLQPFGLLGTTDFLLLALCFMTGTAALPSLLQRAGTSLSVAGARQSGAWAVFLLALLLITLPVLATFAKYISLHELIGKPFSQLPTWFETLTAAQLIEAGDDNRDGILGLQEFLVSRDSIALALPIMAGFPYVLVGLIAIAGLSAGLAAANAQIVSIANAISNDLFYAIAFPQASAAKRLLVARLLIIACGITGALLASSFELDVLRVAAWALSLSAASFFPVLLLSIWWRPLTAGGATAGMLTGFIVTAAYILGVESADFPLVFGLDSLVAGIIGMPLGLLVAFATSLLFKRKPTEETDGGQDIADELLDEMRVAAGETTYDRYLRIMSRRQGNR